MQEVINVLPKMGIELIMTYENKTETIAQAEFVDRFINKLNSEYPDLIDPASQEKMHQHFLKMLFDL
jgi:hypothetical protein